MTESPVIIVEICKPPQFLSEEGVLLYKNVRKNIKNFDLLFFKGSNLISTIISETEKRQTSNGSYTHIGMALDGSTLPSTHPLYARDRVYILESNMGGELSGDKVGSALDGKSFFGVQIRNLDLIMQRVGLENEVGWAPIDSEKVFNKTLYQELTKPTTNESREKIAAIFDRYVGLNYDATLVDLGASAGCLCFRQIRKATQTDKKSTNCCAAGIVNYVIRKKMKNKIAPAKATDSPRDRMICSELTARVLQNAEIIQPGSVNSENVIPVDFLPKNNKETWDADHNVPLICTEVLKVKGTP